MDSTKTMEDFTKAIRDNNLQEILNIFMKNENILNVLYSVIFGEKKELKYTISELREIEIKLEEKKIKNKSETDLITVVIGFYLGRVVIKHIPGSKWKKINIENTKDIGRVSVEFPTTVMHENKTIQGKMEFMPFIRVSKFLDDNSFRMSTLVRVSELNSEICMDNEYWSLRTDGEGWITLASGDMLRLTKVENIQHQK